jgi:DNA-binding CsgD family transcriptional regulator
MIGREHELRLVASFLDGAGPGTHALLLRGEAGIGKSTIWQSALTSAAGRGYRVVVTRPTPAEAGIPFAALNDLLGDLADAVRPELPPPQAAALDVALMRADVGGPPLQPLALSLAVLELLRLAAARQPLAIAIDDAPWLDEASTSALRFALRRLDRERVLVIATQRTDAGSGPPAVLTDLPDGRLTTLDVTALAADDVERLLEAALDLRLTPAVARRTHQASGGNPFYALEIGRAIKAHGTDRPIDAAALPRSRLAALPPDGVAVVRHAAAMSHPSEAALGAAIGGSEAERGLRAAREAGILTADDDPIRFTHPLLAAEASSGIGDDERRAIHRRLASVVTDPDELARHLALGADGPDEAVAQRLDEAAARVYARGAPDAAADLSQLAADLTPPTDPARARRLAAAGRFRLRAGDAARARQLLESALGEPAARGGPPRAELLLALAVVRQLMDDFAASVTIGEEALHHAADDAALAIEIKLLLAGASFITGTSWAAGARHATEAMALAEELDDPRVLAGTIGHFASWQYATGTPLDPEIERRAAELEPSTIHLRALDLPAYDFASIHYADGETTRAHGVLHALLERAERENDASSLPFLLANLSQADLLAGDHAAARERLDRAERLAEVTGQATAQVHALAWRVRIEARLGNADAAIAAAHRALELMDSTSWRVAEWWMRAELAVLVLSRGDATAARAWVADALDPSDEDETGRRAWARVAGVDILVALGRLGEARELLAALDRFVASRPSPRLRGEVLRARARLMAAEGDIAGADAAISEALQIHRAMDDRWEVARTLLLAGEIDRRARRRAQARAALREALSSFASLGAGPWASQVQQQLARIGGAAHAPGTLTATQREVAELVVSGLTNRQAADRLFMSPHTVEAHLSAIYRALGIGSRRDLEAALSGDGTSPRDSDPDSRDSARP